MKSRFTQGEVRQIVQESRVEGVAIVAQKHNISEQTLYNWRKRFGIISVSNRIGELRRLRLENARLKRMVAERDLDIDLMKENAGMNVAYVMPTSEAGFSESWSEVARGVRFAGFSEDEENRAENKT